MTQLDRDLSILRRLFEPWHTAPHGPVIWEPAESDPNAQFKRGMIAKANELLAAGDSALAGIDFKVPQFGEAEFSAIEETLGVDAEQREFVELAIACKNVVQSLAKVAA